MHYRKKEDITEDELEIIRNMSSILDELFGEEHVFEYTEEMEREARRLNRFSCKDMFQIIG